MAHFKIYLYAIAFHVCLVGHAEAMKKNVTQKNATQKIKISTRKDLTQTGPKLNRKKPPTITKKMATDEAARNSPVVKKLLRTIQKQYELEIAAVIAYRTKTPGSEKLLAEANLALKEKSNRAEDHEERIFIVRPKDVSIKNIYDAKLVFQFDERGVALAVVKGIKVNGHDTSIYFPIKEIDTFLDYRYLVTVKRTTDSGYTEEYHTDTKGWASTMVVENDDVVADYSPNSN